MSLTARKILMFALSCTLTALFYLGAIEGNEVAWNFSAFTSWTFAVIITLGWAAAKGSDVLRERLFKTYRDGKHFPIWFDVALYLAKISVFVWSGHFVYGALWTWMLMLDLNNREQALKPTMVVTEQGVLKTKDAD